MSRQIVEERVVEMKFDNAQFERETKKTYNTLTKLKEALKFTDSEKALNGLERSAKNIRFDGAAAGIEILQKRFSTLGIVGMQTISNITNALENKLVGVIKYTTDAIVSGGVKRAMNIENAHFQLQALLKDEEKVQAVMADAMESVDGTAYAYDEAAKAASQFAASGIEAGEEMLGALKGITGVAAMTNSDFESISNIFTTVAGNGRLMGDQLNQLASRGLNAASTIAEYFQKVREESNTTEGDIRKMVTAGQLDFKTFADAMTWAFGDSAKRANETFNGALSNMKSALARIGAGFISPLVEQNGVLVNLFNALRVQINAVKSELVFDEQTSAIKGLGSATSWSNDEITALFNTVSKRGSVAKNDLQMLHAGGIDAYNALKRYINGVADGSIYASYATKKAIDEFAEGSEVGFLKLNKLLKDGKIDAAMFTSAMEHSFGNSKSITKQFTDFFIKEMKALVNVISEADLTYPMATFYKSVDIIKHSVSGLLTIVKPLGSAFTSVFGISGQNVVKLADDIDKLVQKMSLSTKHSKQLEAGAKGLLNLIKMISKGLLGTVSSATALEDPLSGILDLFFDLIEVLGNGLTNISNFVDKSETASTALNFLRTAIGGVSNGFYKFIKFITDSIKSIGEIDAVSKIFENVTTFFKDLDKNTSSGFRDFNDLLKDFSVNLENLITPTAEGSINGLSNVLKDLTKVGNDINPKNWGVKTITDFCDTLINYAGNNEGMVEFVKHVKEFFIEAQNAFTLDGVTAKVNAFMAAMDKFTGWVKKTLLPTFSNFTIGAGVTAGTSFGMLYFLNSIAKSMEKITTKVLKIPDILSPIKGVLKAYQKDLEANRLIKIAGAIAILSASLIALSFADPKRLVIAALAMSVLFGGLTAAFTALSKLLSTGNELSDIADKFSKRFSKSIKKIGKTFLSIAGLSIAIISIATAFALIAKTYSTDKEAFKIALITIGVIVGSIVALTVILSAFGSKLEKGVDLSYKVALSIGALAGALAVCVKALNMLMAMNLPEDAEKRMTLIAEILLTLAGLSTLLTLSMMGVRGKGKKKKAQKLLTPILEIAGALFIAVLALKKLNQLKLSDDIVTKLVLLGGIFVTMGTVVAILTAIGKGKNTTIKAAGTIAALGAFLFAAVAAIGVLSTFKVEAILKGAIGLGLVLSALALVFAGMSKMKPNPNLFKAIYGCVMLIAAIAVALALLSTIPFKDKLLPAVIALGLVLLAVAEVFDKANKHKYRKGDWTKYLASIAIIAEVGYALYKLSEQPWDDMLGAAAGLSACLIAYAEAFSRFSKSKLLKKTKFKASDITRFALFAAVTAELGYILYKLAVQPWSGMVSSAAALSASITAFAKAIETISEVTYNKDDLKKVGQFIVMCFAVLPLGVALYALSNQPWSGMIGAAAALSICILAFTEAFNILTKSKGFEGWAQAGQAFATMGVLAAASIALVLALKPLSEQPWQGLIGAAVSLGICVNAFASAYLILTSSKGFGSLAQAGSALGSMLVLTGIACLLVYALKPLADQPWQGLIGGAVALSILLGSMSGVVAVLSLIGAKATGAIPAAVVLIAVIGILAAGFIAIGNLIDLIETGDINSVEQVNKVFDVLSAIAEGIGRVATSFVAGAMAGLVSTLPEIGTQLSAFTQNASRFFIMLKSLGDSENLGENARGLAQAILILFATSVLERLTSLIGMDFTSFGETLAQFGDGVKQFADCLTEVDNSKLENAVQLAKIIALLGGESLVNSIITMATFGLGGISTFGQQLAQLGQGVANFSKAIEGVGNFTEMKSATLIIESLANMKVNTHLGKALKHIQKLIDICENVKKVNGSDLKNFADSLGDIGKAGLTQFVFVFTNSSDRASEAVNGFMKVMLEQFDEKKESFKLKGKAILLLVIAGMKEAYPDATTVGNELVNRALTPIYNATSRFKSAGENAVQGFINGMNGKLSDVEKTAKKVGDGAADTLKKTLEERSPSKRTRKIGDFAGVGFVLGLRPYIAKAAKTATDIGETTVKSLGNSMDKEMSNLDNFFDDPVIRPIVDLSNVRKSSDEVYGMFNDSIRMSGFELQHANAAIQRQKQQPTTADEIYRLRKDLIDSKSGGDSYYVNGISYQEREDVGKAIKTLIHAADVRKKV